MSLPKSVADVIGQHVTFELESIDRMDLNVYQPLLQTGGGVSCFFRGHRGEAFATALLQQVRGVDAEQRRENQHQQQAAPAEGHAGATHGSAVFHIPALTMPTPFHDATLAMYGNQARADTTF